MPPPKPQRPFFASGPSVKPETWALARLDQKKLNRYHRNPQAQTRLSQANAKIRALLAIPPSHSIMTTPASASGAMETALWNLVHPDKSLCALVWDRFSALWAETALKLNAKTSIRRAPYGQIPKLHAIEEDDILFTWNGTTAGTWLGRDIPLQAQGLVLCDATSVVMMHPIPWHRLDAVAFSLQKTLGCEAHIGWLVLNHKALKRAHAVQNIRAIPRLLSILDRHVNSISLLLLEDLHHCLEWAEQQGSQTLAEKTWYHHSIIADWVDNCTWLDFLAVKKDHRPPAPITLIANDLVGTQQQEKTQFIDQLCQQLENQHAAYDIKAHHDAPVGLRIWTGPTMHPDDLTKLTQWLDWTYRQLRHD